MDKKGCCVAYRDHHPGGSELRTLKGTYFVEIYTLWLLQVFLKAVSRSKFFAAELESAVLMWLEMCAF